MTPLPPTRFAGLVRTGSDQTGEEQRNAPGTSAWRICGEEKSQCPRCSGGLWPWGVVPAVGETCSGGAVKLLAVLPPSSTKEQEDMQ